MKRITLLTITTMCFSGFITINQSTFAQGNNGGNANTNNNANGNALKWETQGNNADTDDFIGTTNPTALKMRTNNVERFKITPDGKIGVGIANPLEKFELQGNLKLTGDVIFKGYEDLQNPENRFMMIDKTGKTTPVRKNILKTFMSVEDCYEIKHEVSFVGETGNVKIVAAGTYPDWAKRIEGFKSIIYTGTDCPAWVGIGTYLPDARLDVIGDARFSDGVRIGNQDETETALHIKNKYLGSGNNMFDKLIVVKDHEDNKVLQLDNNGLLRARKIRIDLEDWSDFVFEEDYPLMPLADLKIYIAKNKHLPEIPSEEELVEEGLDLAEMNKLLMQKIEELTLYLLDQNEKTEKLQQEIDELKKQLSTLK